MGDGGLTMLPPPRPGMGGGDDDGTTVRGHGERSAGPPVVRVDLRGPLRGTAAIGATWVLAVGPEEEEYALLSPAAARAASDFPSVARYLSLSASGYLVAAESLTRFLETAYRTTWDVAGPYRVESPFVILSASRIALAPDRQRWWSWSEACEREPWRKPPPDRNCPDCDCERSS